MYALTSINYSTRFCVFSIDSETDLNSLPTQNEAGKDTLQSIKSCAMGSVAHSTDGKTYVLNGDTDTWVLYNTINNNNVHIERISREDIETLF